MPSTVQKISRYAIQVLNKRTGPAPRPSIIVRLYEDGGKMVGTAVFKNYGDMEAELSHCRLTASVAFMPQVPFIFCGTVPLASG